MTTGALKGAVLAVVVALLMISCTLSGISPTSTAPATPVWTPTERQPPSRRSCGDGRCEGPENPRNCPDDCPDPTATQEQPQPATALPPSTPEPTVLYLGIMVHLEGWSDDTDEARFQKHAQLIREYADLFETYGARLTWESKEVTDAVVRWGDNVLLEMEQRGHGIGVHADIGGQRDYDCDLFAADLRAEREQLASLGVTVRHVSGIVSHCDWVTAAAEAGYQFTTGQVAYAVMSMPEELRPPQYRDCPTPARCHDTFPEDLADRIHPWRAESGANWLTHDPAGQLVLLASSQTLPCMMEELTGAEIKDCGHNFTQADLDSFFQQLEQAIALSEPGHVNVYYVSWSLGSQLDRSVLDAWLSGIVPYVQSGQVQWATLPEMYDVYVRWEQRQP